MANQPTPEEYEEVRKYVTGLRALSGHKNFSALARAAGIEPTAYARWRSEGGNPSMPNALNLLRLQHAAGVLRGKARSNALHEDAELTAAAEDAARSLRRLLGLISHEEPREGGGEG